MTRGRASLSVVAALLAYGDANASPANDIIQQTRTTTATYVVYARMHVTIPGEAPFVDWSAELHSGTKHRIDAGRHRMIADCAAGTGTYHNVQTGKRSSGAWVAAAACGINANKHVIAAIHLGEHRSDFGKVTRVRVTDNDEVRTYDILPSGAILNSRYASPPPASATLIRQEAVAVDDRLPPGDLFSEASLERSVVPERYRR